MTANDIRNIALLGHGGSGKTSLVEQMLFMTKGIDRLGKTADGNTTCDYDAEEIKRQISISLAFAPVMYKGKKINVMDAPGNFDFSGEAVCAIRAAECAVIVGNAKDGLSVGMERTWKMLGKKPRMMFINRVEEANSDYVSCIETIKGKYGTAIAPIVATKADANKAVTVIVDLLHNKAYDAKGECAIPGDMADEVEALRAELMEAAAGADEELMEKFFETMELSAEDMAKGLKLGVRDGSVCPVLCGSAITGLGVEMLMQTILDLVPVATDMPAEAAEDDDGNAIEVAYDPNGPIDGVSVAQALGQDPACVFKTLVTRGASGGYYVFDIPVAENLDLKKAARAVGEKSVAMLPQKELLPLTGYVHGGCSPVGMKKQFPTVFHETAPLYDTVCVSAGKIGHQVECDPNALIALLRAKTADVIV